MPTLSPSQLSIFQLCNRRWQYQYKEGLLPRVPSSRQMAKGSYIHDILHYYYGLIQAGYPVGDPDLLVLIRDRINQDIKETPNPDYKFFEECARTVVNYILDRSPVIDSKLKDLQVEAHLEYTLLNGYVLHGFVDLISDAIRDHKTGERNTFDSKSVSRNQQLMFYSTLYFKLTGDNLPVEISWIHSNPPKTSKNPIYSLTRTSFSDAKLEGFFDYLEKITDLLLTDQDHLQNFSACGNCPYFHLCDFELKGLDTALLRKNGYVNKSTKNEATKEDSKDKPLQALDLRWRGN